MELNFAAVTPERWSDLESLFGSRGACGGCWCMSWRHPTRAAFEAAQGQENHDLFQAVVASGEVPGLLAYAEGKPVGWCAVAPRSAYPRLEKMRVLKGTDGAGVWAISCLFVAKGHRRMGISRALIRAAVEHARTCGARVVEAYPTEPKQELPGPFLFTGLASAFRQEGFTEVARRGETRLVMRLNIV
ncbi:MAG: GNAT family N-acetyltransferase [Mycobacterium leprae]